MQLSSLHDLYVMELKDLYSAEQQLIKALPKVAKAVSSSDLQQAFQHHLEQTRGHAQRLEQIFQKLNMSPGSETCEGMEGLLKEGEEMIKQKADAAVKDAGLIAAAQRVEHYEIAGYGTVRTYAKHLGHDEEARLLQQTLDEEEQTDKKLTQLAERGINIQAKS